MKYIGKTKKKYPVFYNGQWYNRKDCGEIFLMFYTCVEALRADGSVYIGDRTWIYPDDKMIHD